jgi:threonylcarbamoyladenosine tRNA methylthiotransferase MtaB
VEPGICDAALLDAIEAHPNVCRSVHLSLQSGSNRILRLMRRPYTIEHVAAFCEEARRRLGPRLAIGADVIAGFPGETDADFDETREFLISRQASFPHLHVFPYSEREGTEAATMPSAVPVGVRRSRAKELEAVGAKNRDLFARGLVGREVTVCVEKGGNGRTEEYMRCMLKGTARRRSLVRAKVDDYFPQTGMLSATICA